MSMSGIDRRGWRNTYIYAAPNLSRVIAGLWAAPDCTHYDLFAMMEISLLFTAPFRIRDEHGQFLECDDKPLLIGKYYVVTPGRCLL